MTVSVVSFALDPVLVLLELKETSLTSVAEIEVLLVLLALPTLLLELLPELLLGSLKPLLLSALLLLSSFLSLLLVAPETLLPSPLNDEVCCVSVSEKSITIGSYCEFIDTGVR